MNVGLFVALLLVGIALFNAIIWLVVIRWARQRAARAMAALQSELSASGERVVRGPEKGLYRGATGTYSRVAGNAVLLLTDRRLAIRRALGEPFDVPVDDIVGVREAKAFLGSIRAGRMHVVIKVRSGDELGLMVKDNHGWLSALGRG